MRSVDAYFPGTQARMSTSYRWLEIAEQIAQNKRPQESTLELHGKMSAHASPNSRRSTFSLTGIMKRIALAVWRTFPSRVRVAAYNQLRKIGQRLYGSGPTAMVQRLPFGLYLKAGGDPEGFRNEYNTLKLVRKYTKIPVPEPLDVTSAPSKSKDFPEDGYLVTTRLPGHMLQLCRVMLSDEDIASFVTQMQDIVAQIRAIPKTTSPEHTICNTLGGAIRDPRIRGARPQGPFATEAEFNQNLRNRDDPARSGHRALFTHADLNPRNILLDLRQKPDGTRGWVVTGIVDWENSGYYPEYWEYTKSLFEGFRLEQQWQDVMHDIFKAFGDMSKEYEVEKRSWEQGDYVSF